MLCDRTAQMEREGEGKRQRMGQRELCLGNDNAARYLREPTAGRPHLCNNNDNALVYLRHGQPWRQQQLLPGPAATAATRSTRIVPQKKNKKTTKNKTKRQHTRRSHSRPEPGVAGLSLCIYVSVSALVSLLHLYLHLKQARLLLLWQLL